MSETREERLVNGTSPSPVRTLEFTGERVIPGLAEPDLWNEHISRYEFASLFSAGKRVLDVGCGTGYGTAFLAGNAATAVGFDISVEAIAYATANYGGTTHFFSGSASAFPVPDDSFDLITVFEVIEHIEDWPALLKECARVLSKTGVCLISTPNTEYYAETRAVSGPNPFHIHEFASNEFYEALHRNFPCTVHMAQNLQESVTFAGVGEQQGVTFVASPPAIADAHFFIGICSKEPVPVRPFAYVARAGNQLRERERHIRLLEEQLRAAQSDHLKLLTEHEQTERELIKHNDWALELAQDLEEAREKLSNEQENGRQLAEDFRAVVEKLERDSNEKAAWARDAAFELDLRSEELLRVLEMLASADQELKERAEWARSFEEMALERTAWAIKANQELEERTAWARSLERELEDRTTWAKSLEKTLEERTTWAQSLASDLDRRTAWALSLSQELEERTAWAKQLAADVEERTAWALSLDAELHQRTAWALSLNAELQQRTASTLSLEEQLAAATRRAVEAEDLRRKLHDGLQEAETKFSGLLSRLVHRRLSTITLRDQFALAARLTDALLAEREQVRSSKWLKLGNLLHLGPKVEEDPPL